MKNRKILIVIMAIVLTITCMPLTAMADENPVQKQEINILEGGFYITNADGSIAPTPKYIIDEGVRLESGQLTQ